MTSSVNDEPCQILLDGLRQGDFTRLAPYFTRVGASPPPILAMLSQPCFANRLDERAEALTCACFLGAIEVVEQLLDAGASPVGGMATWMNAMHWATNRGQVEVVRLLLEHGVPLEIRNGYGGTVLGGTVWAAIHEPKPTHAAIVEELLRAGADVREAGYPTGDATLDALLKRFGARGSSE